MILFRVCLRVWSENERAFYSPVIMTGTPEISHRMGFAGFERAQPKILINAKATISQTCKLDAKWRAVYCIWCVCVCVCVCVRHQIEAGGK